MKFLLLLLALGTGTDFPDSDIDRVPGSEVSHSSCDPSQTARQIIAGKKKPRSILFHYGKKETLMEDVAAKTIPEHAWNQFIMGNQTRFHLRRFRRGLYGTERVESADSFGSTAYNWLIEIQLKDSCLVPERIATINGIARSPMFKHWYESKSFNRDYRSWKTSCFLKNGEPNPNQFNFYGKEKLLNHPIEEPESDCEKVVADFYEQKSIAMVQDDAGDLVLSWALRDRECIETILGSSEYWAKQFAVREELWTNECPIKRQRNHRNNIRVWFSALYDAGFKSVDLEQFSKMIATLQPPEDVVNWQTDEVDRFAAQDFAVVLSKVAKRCEKNGQKRKLQETLQGIANHVDDLQSEEVRFTLESACR
jgi:hypothetical protein